jgi:uncharacterized protein YegP (UPF0339 family)
MTARLVPDALIMAIWRREKPERLLHYSDQGDQLSVSAQSCAGFSTETCQSGEVAEEPLQGLRSDGETPADVARFATGWTPVLRIRLSMGEHRKHFTVTKRSSGAKTLRNRLSSTTDRVEGQMSSRTCRIARQAASGFVGYGLSAPLVSRVLDWHLAQVIHLQGETSMAHKFEIYKDKAGEYRVRFKYNSEVMFATEGYSSKASAQNAIDSIKKNGPGAPVEDNTTPQA